MDIDFLFFEGGNNVFKKSSDIRIRFLIEMDLMCSFYKLSLL